MRSGLSLWDLAIAVPDVRAVLVTISVVVATAALWTARRRAARLAQQTNRLRALTDVAFDGLAVARGGTIVDVNPALTRLMGVGPAWFEHRPVASVLSGGNPEARAQPVEETLILPD